MMISALQITSNQIIIIFITKKWCFVSSCLSVILFCFFLAPLHASPASERTFFKNLLFDFEGQLAQIDITRSNQKAHHELLTEECDYPYAMTNEGEVLRDQSRQTDNISGFELRGALNSGNITDNSDDDSSFEKGLGNLELSWDLLKNGYLQHNLRAQTLKLEAQRADLIAQFKDLEQTYQCRHYQIEKEFSGLVIQLLDMKLQFLETVYQLERRAYFKQWSFLDDYLVSEGDLLLTKHELNELLADPYLDKDPVYQRLPPIIDINLAGLLTAIRNDESHSALFAVEKDWLRAADNAIVRDSLRLYLRQEFDTGGTTNDELVAGLRFRIPLYSRKSNLLNLKLNQVETRQHNLTWQRIMKTRQRYFELKEHQRRTIKHYYRHARAQERLRRTIALIKKGEDKLLTTGITRMKTFIDSRIELALAEQELYRRINEMFLTAGVPYKPHLIETLNLQPTLLKGRPGHRSIYLWTHTFNTIENRDLIAFMKVKNITRVLISAGKKIDVVKSAAFLAELPEHNIDAEIIIGDNSWIFTDKHEKAVENSIICAEKTGTIHFDIEPQTLPSYHAKREEYLGHFRDLVGKVKAQMMDRQLSLAVPFHWPKETYEELGKIADRLYIMAYGTNDPKVLIRRITPALETVPHDKIVITLRVDDFHDEWAMEKTIESLITETAIEAFCIHNLGHFIQKSGTIYGTTN